QHFFYPHSENSEMIPPKKLAFDCNNVAINRRNIKRAVGTQLIFNDESRKDTLKVAIIARKDIKTFVKPHLVGCKSTE
ncbi:MAG TPA: hypothetical protein PLU23_06325, partial [Anaerolineaceae bacterium]|nr:hypothetical protein [Anaerolineaceae bacterium]